MFSGLLKAIRTAFYPKKYTRSRHLRFYFFIWFVLYLCPDVKGCIAGSGPRAKSADCERKPAEGASRSEPTHQPRGGRPAGQPPAVWLCSAAPLQVSSFSRKQGFHTEISPNIFQQDSAVCREVFFFIGNHCTRIITLTILIVVRLSLSLCVFFSGGWRVWGWRWRQPVVNLLSSEVSRSGTLMSSPPAQKTLLHQVTRLSQNQDVKKWGNPNPALWSRPKWKPDQKSPNWPDDPITSLRESLRRQKWWRTRKPNS